MLEATRIIFCSDHLRLAQFCYIKPFYYLFYQNARTYSSFYSKKNLLTTELQESRLKNNFC